MAPIDVGTCFVLTGLGAAVGLALMSLVRTDEARVRDSVTLYKIALALLTGMALQACLPDPWRAEALKHAIGLAAMAVAVLGLAFRELNGRRTHRWLGAGLVASAGCVVSFGATLEPLGFEVAMACTFTAIGLLVSLDQLHLVRLRGRVRAGELTLVVVAIGFTLIWALTLRHALTSPDPVPPHWIHAPPWLVPLAALSYALLPLAVAAVALAIINDRLMQTVRAHALSDELTGLLSRRGLREMGHQMLDGEPGEPGRPGMIAMLMIDVDHFKSINDRWGHLIGDEVLRHVAAVIRSHLRSDALLARYGGEEFTVLLPLQHVDEAHTVAERLRQAVEQTPCATASGPIRVSVSVGVAHYRRRETLDQALGRADERLYEAKQTGRNRVVVAPL